MRNGSFRVTDFRLYDEISSLKGRSPAAHIAQTSRVSHASPSSLPKQMMACWILLAANVRKMLARPARLRSVFDDNPNYSVTDSV